MTSMVVSRESAAASRSWSDSQGFVAFQWGEKEDKSDI